MFSKTYLATWEYCVQFHIKWHFLLLLSSIFMHLRQMLQGGFVSRCHKLALVQFSTRGPVSSARICVLYQKQADIILLRLSSAGCVGSPDAPKAGARHLLVNTIPWHHIQRNTRDRQRDYTVTMVGSLAAQHASNAVCNAVLQFLPGCCYGMPHILWNCMTVLLPLNNLRIWE